MKRLLLSAGLGLLFISPGFAGGTISWPTPPPPTGSNPAIYPVSPITGWLNHFQQVIDTAHAAGTIDLIFDGDTYAITGNASTGARGGMWGPRFANINCFEFSNAGDATQTVLWRLQNGQVDGLHPKLVVLLVGAGNIQTNTPEQIAAGIKADVEEYEKRCPEATILLQGVFPRQQLPTHAFRTKIKAINQLISALGDGRKVIYLDFGDKFLQPDGTMTKEMFYDFNFPRPSPQAYKIWLDAIGPVLDQFFPPATTTSNSTATASTSNSAPTATSASNSAPAAPSVPYGSKTVTWPDAPVPPGGNSAIIPVPPMGHLDALQKNINNAQKMQPGIIFDGDSITAGWMGGGGAVWNKNFAPYKAIDFGVSGDTTQGLLWRVQNGQVDGISPKLMVLLIGTNNTGGCTAEQIAEGIKADVEEYEKRLPDATILLQGVLPRSEKPTDPIRAKVKAINQIIAGLADGKKVIFLDWGAKLLTPDGLYTMPITHDFLHPNTPGYQIWADAIKPVVEQVLGPPPAPPAPPAKPAAPAKPATSNSAPAPAAQAAPPATTTTSTPPAP